jgi:hypothetical protein
MTTPRYVALRMVRGDKRDYFPNDEIPEFSTWGPYNQRVLLSNGYVACVDAHGNAVTPPPESPAPQRKASDFGIEYRPLPPPTGAERASASLAPEFTPAEKLAASLAPGDAPARADPTPAKPEQAIGLDQPGATLAPDDARPSQLADEDGAIICPDCPDAVFSSSRGLSIHRSKAHGGDAARR